MTSYLKNVYKSIVDLYFRKNAICNFSELYIYEMNGTNELSKVFKNIIILLFYQNY